MIKNIEKKSITKGQILKLRDEQNHIFQYLRHVFSLYQLFMKKPIPGIYCVTVYIDDSNYVNNVPD